MSELIKTGSEVKNVIAKIHTIALEQSLIDKLPEYQNLKLTDVESEDEYKDIKAKWQEVRRTRLDKEKIAKELKAPVLSLSRMIDDQKNRLANTAKPVEDHLRAEMKKYEDHKEAEELKAYEEAKQKMLDVGYVFDGRNFICGNAIISNDEFKKEHTNEVKLKYWLEDGAQLKAMIDAEIAKQEAAMKSIEANKSKQTQGEATSEAQTSHSSNIPSPPPRAYTHPESITHTGGPGLKDTLITHSYNEAIFDAAKLVRSKGHVELARELLKLRR